MAIIYIIAFAFGNFCSAALRAYIVNRRLIQACVVNVNSEILFLSHVGLSRCISACTASSLKRACLS